MVQNMAKITGDLVFSKVKAILPILILIAYLPTSAEVLHKLKYPFVSELNGKVEIEVLHVKKTGERKPIKKNDLLLERAHIFTPSQAQVRIELDEKNSITLLEKSELEIPVIDLENGQVLEVHLLNGRLRVDSEDGNQRYYSTPITRDIYSDADFLIQYDSSLVRASATVFRGVLAFRGQENEISARVSSKERVSFQGVLESGLPSFDILLKGRKVARGTLTAVESLSAEVFAELDKETSVQKPKVKVVKLDSRNSGLCTKPFANLNECVWTCEGMPKKQSLKKAVCNTQIKGVHCIRRRCNANGEWVDPYEVPASEGRCETQAKVSDCDY